MERVTFAYPKTVRGTRYKQGDTAEVDAGTAASLRAEGFATTTTPEVAEQDALPLEPEFLSGDDWLTDNETEEV